MLIAVLKKIEQPDSYESASVQQTNQTIDEVSLLKSNYNDFSESAPEESELETSNNKTTTTPKFESTIRSSMRTEIRLKKEKI